MNNNNLLKKGRRMGDLKYMILSVISVLTFLLIWQLLVIFGVLSTRTIAAPTQVLVTFFEKFYSTAPDGATIFTNIAVSLKVSLTGFFSAIIIGTPLGMLMGWYKPLDRFIRPLFEIIRPIPPIAWIPLTILWVGIGLGAKAMIIFFSAFVPCVINSYTGIKLTSQVHVSVAKTFGASNFKIFRTVGVPSSMPMAFAGIRIALGNSWGTLVAAELLAANAGLGYMIMMGRQFVRPDVIILGMLTIGILGFIFTWIFTKIENVVVRWRTL
ncbi:MAG: ABC transporter permease [Anaerolineaceae bacterium]|nr:MAG: ABC transporter permease [Anaerolineaceae bacterium]